MPSANGCLFANAIMVTEKSGNSFTAKDNEAPADRIDPITELQDGIDGYVL